MIHEHSDFSKPCRKDSLSLVQNFGFVTKLLPENPINHDISKSRSAQFTFHDKKVFTSGDFCTSQALRSAHRISTKHTASSIGLNFIGTSCENSISRQCYRQYAFHMSDFQPCSWRQVRIVYSDFMMSVLFVTFITKATPETENHGISISELVLNIENNQQ
jgi:hypothetical protein